MTARPLALGIVLACGGCALIQDFDEYRAASSMVQTESLKACDDVGYGVACQPVAKSCTKAGGACSSEAGNSAACCATIRIEGGMFLRGFDHGGAKEDGKTVLGWVENGAPARVPPFALDRFEVTVGRFRVFVEEYDSFFENLPQLGSGAIPEAAGSGWQLAFGTPLPTTSVRLKEQLKAPSSGMEPAPGAMPPKTRCTWKDSPDATEDLPITCVDWFVALSFCIWDGGRLPSEAEWNFAAAVGAEQRAFPGSVEGPFDARLGVVGTHLVAQVGSKPLGASPAGHHDLAGNVWEWVYDSCGQAMSESSCDEFAYPSCDVCVSLAGPNRWMRGGSFSFFAADARSSARVGLLPSTRFDDLGFRCARDL